MMSLEPLILVAGQTFNDIGQDLNVAHGECKAVNAVLNSFTKTPRCR